MPKIHIFMEERKKPPEALHAWLIMLKAWQSMSRYVFPSLLQEGLGESDFRVLEVLLLSLIHISARADATSESGYRAMGATSCCNCSGFSVW